MNPIFSHFVLLALLGLSTAFSEAGSFRLVPEADGYVSTDTGADKGSANSDVHHDGSLRAQNGDNRYRVKSYLRFNLKCVTGNISTATLRIKARDFEPQDGRTFHFYALSNDADSRGWDERTLSWSHAPANDVTGNGFDANLVTDLGTLALPSAKAGDMIEFSSPQLLGFLLSHAASEVTLMISNDRSAQGNTTFESTRNWNPGGQPTLELTTDSPDTFDQTFDKTITLECAPQRTCEAFGCGFGGGAACLSFAPA